MKRGQQILVILICALLSLCCVVSGAGPPGKHTPARISVVMDDDYPPFIFRSQAGELQGILIDQWKLWEAKTGIGVDIHAMSWGPALARMARGEFDVIDTIFRNRERATLFDFSKPYARIDVPIFFSSNIAGISGPKALAGFSVAVKRGDNCIGILREQGVNGCREFDSYEAIMEAVKAKTVVTFVMDKPPALHYLYKAGLQDTIRFTKPLYSGTLHRAVAKGQAQLLKTVENGFALISAREYRAIDDKWYGARFDRANYVRYVRYAVATALLVSLFLIASSWLLQRVIRTRTRELRHALQQLQESQNENNAIISSIPGRLLLLDRTGAFVDLRSGGQGGGLPLPASGGRIADILPAGVTQLLMATVQELLLTGHPQVMEYFLPSDTTQDLEWYEAHIVMCGDEHILAIVSDITERKRSAQRIYEMSVYDTLTGFFNRNHLEAILKHYEDACPADVGMMVCDIDGLKLVNDTMGHLVGDGYIRTCADILREAVADDGVVARFGGDEFVVFFRETTEARLEGMKNSIYDSVAGSNDGLSIPLSISIGYAFRKALGTSIFELYRQADGYMYTEKIFHLQSAKSRYIELLSKMLEARDFLTEGHGERLKTLAAELATSLEVAPGDLKDIKLLAQFHDIGKIGIPDSILFKPGRLTDDEMETMKRHTEIGFRIAQASPELVHIGDWILKHHERYDGNGYPLGATAEGIPLQCRIISIVDAYDAMTNDRPYRKAMPRADALAELRQGAGSQFDPDMVERFIRIIEGA